MWAVGAAEYKVRRAGDELGRAGPSDGYVDMVPEIDRLRGRVCRCRRRRMDGLVMG